MRTPEAVDKTVGESGPFQLSTFDQQHLWSGLVENVRERFFPRRLPPLDLTSTPIPVIDRMAANTNPWAVGTATLVNGGILAIVLMIGVRAVMPPSAKPGPQTRFKLDDFPFVSSRADSAHGGDGGGDHDLIDANKGRLPKADLHPLAPVQVAVLDHPKLPIENSMAVPPDLKLPDNPSMEMIGVHESTNVRLVSGGPGGPVGIGSGRNGVYGPGDGLGWGPGSGPGIYTAGVNGVSQPVPIFTPEAEFSDEARRQKYQGVCLISLIVDAHGNPQSPRVVRRLGMGLDEKALDAVSRYRFKPAKKDGKPVAVRMTVEVNFRMY
jgi:protein TonB